MLVALLVVQSFALLLFAQVGAEVKALREAVQRPPSVSEPRIVWPEDGKR